MPALEKNNLFQPDRYKVLLGERPDIGFCTVWNDPDIVVRRNPQTIQQSAIIGTLYSRGGVNIILRNLARNPSIVHLVLWGNGPLSNTPYGTAGSEVVRVLWKNGVGDDGVVRGHGFRIEKALDPAAIQKIIGDVEFHDLSRQPLEEVVKTITTLPTRAPQREPIVFPDPQIDENAAFPSELVGWTVRGRTIVEAWLQVLDRILRYGVIKGSEHGLRQRELVGITWVITVEDPDAPQLPRHWPTALQELVGATQAGLTTYRHEFLSTAIPDNTAYTYGSRLGAYPTGNGQALNQLQKIVADFKRSPDTRRAVATTMVPSTDERSPNPPCLTHIQLIQENGRLHMLASFRSHDIFKAAIPNAYGLRSLHKFLAEETNYEMGVMAITSQSAHIYESDWEEAKKLWKCEVVERKPHAVFVPERDADPRGNLVISLTDGIIRVELQGMEGERLVELEGKTAKELGQKISQLGLLSRPDHMLDIGTQLGWAEFCLAHNLPFHQDRLPVLAKQ